MFFFVFDEVNWMSVIVLSISVEWEAVKNTEPAKDFTSQPVSADTTAASNTQTETFNQQVTMMPVQVQQTEESALLPR